MIIYVKCFAQLREHLGIDERSLSFEECSKVSVKDVWQSIAGDVPIEEYLHSCNFHYVDHDHLVSDGDEVAFFPKVTGG